jgi:hypothetical protein
MTTSASLACQALLTRFAIQHSLFGGSKTDYELATQKNSHPLRPTMYGRT